MENTKKTISKCKAKLFLIVISYEKHLWTTFCTSIHCLKYLFSAQNFSAFKVENHYLGLARNEILSLVSIRSDRIEKPRHFKRCTGISGLLMGDSVRFFTQIINQSPIKGLIFEQFYFFP